MPTVELCPRPRENRRARRYADGLSNADGISWYADESCADGETPTATVGT
jgi:hypothetical protein